MEYINKDLGTYKLHMIKTKKFKTIKIRVSFRNKIKKEEITMRNILSDMLTYSTKSCKTKRDFNIKAQNLYAATVISSNTRYGNYINTDITMTVLNDKYTEKGNYNEAVKFLKEIIYSPNVVKNKFNEEQLETIKVNVKTSLESLKEDSSYYSILRLYEEMDEDSPLSYRMCGYIEDLDKINTSNLYDCYKNMIDKDLMDVFVIGDIDFTKTEKLIKDNFSLKTFKRNRTEYYLEDKKPRSKKLIVKEQDENSQSKLVIGCRTHNITKYERDYPLTLCNIIFGGSTESKLFREIREKRSLCYTISSVPNKLDNVIMIRSGVDKKNIKKAVKFIEDELNKMKKGKFSDEDIAKAKEYYNTAIESIEETENGIIETYYMMDLLKLDDIETRVKKMNEVTKADIVRVAKKIKIDTIFCLEGVKE